MSIIDSAKNIMLIARKNSNKGTVAIMSVLLGEIQNLQFSRGQQGDVRDEQVVRIIKKLIKSNNETKDRLDDDNPKHQQLVVENTILEQLLPEALTRPQIREILSKFSAIKEAAKDGQAIGIAMKILTSEKAIVEGENVAMVVKDLRDEV